MAGIYIHIPFCRKACHYCNFHFSTSFNLREETVSAIEKEIELQAGYLQHESIETIYFGGGTPSVLEPNELRRILDAIYKFHPVAALAEITLEANPDDIHAEILGRWQRCGINRLSLGLQGFQDEMLKNWNRSHTGLQALQSLELVLEHGFENISADLIYGDPVLGDDAWISNVEKLVDFKIPHLSAYALTVETGTALHHQILKGKAKPVEDEKSHRQYDLLRQLLNASGYLHYEISNFSKPGFMSRHNTSYWSGISYLGIGPSAHSYNIHSRQWNVSHNPKYVEAIRKGIIPAETEELTPEKKYNETVMTGLRTIRGIDMEEIKRMGSGFSDHFEINVGRHVKSGKIELTPDGYYRLLPAYYFFADGIAGDLFRV